MNSKNTFDKKFTVLWYHRKVGFAVENLEICDRRSVKILFICFFKLQLYLCIFLGEFLIVLFFYKALKNGVLLPKYNATSPRLWIVSENFYTNT